MLLFYNYSADLKSHYDNIFSQNEKNVIKKLFIIRQELARTI